MSSVHTLSHYLISILILSFYLYISILRVSSLEVIGESLVYIFFILKAFIALIVTTFDSNLMSVAVLVDGIEGVRHVSC
jgi:hypothetical protein